ncbi:hypothetical protein VKT23_010722 [Stygiomarasmius scandens]|uniref:Transposase n=1 Tax=Marasmiellus scandens TaxID=2682957 RepID=A0ABR1JDR3_9AGAR
MSPHFWVFEPYSVLCHLYKDEYEDLKLKAPPRVGKGNLAPHNYARDQLAKNHENKLDHAQAIADAWNQTLREAEAGGVITGISPELAHSRVEQGIQAVKSGLSSIQKRFGIRQMTILSWEEFDPERKVKLPQLIW